MGNAVPEYPICADNNITGEGDTYVLRTILVAVLYQTWRRAKAVTGRLDQQRTTDTGEELAR